MTKKLRTNEDVKFEIFRCKVKHGTLDNVYYDQKRGCLCRVKTKIVICYLLDEAQVHSWSMIKISFLNKMECYVGLLTLVELHY